MKAQKIGSKIVERSAWPSASYDVEAVDLGEELVPIEVGDIIEVPYKSDRVRQRIVQHTTDIAQPRALAVTLGDDPNTTDATIARIQKDVDSTFSAINTTTGAADL